MDLDQIKLSRRNFLKLLSAAAAGAAVPALHMPVEGPVQYNDLAGLTGGIAPRTRFMQPHLAIMEGSILSTTMMVDHSAQGDGALRLFWTGTSEEAEFGWWADYLEMHVGPMGKWVSGKPAIPETVRRLQSWGPDAVTRSDLGRLKMLPGELLNLNLYAPDVAAPWNTVERELLIHGLELTYEA